MEPNSIPNPDNQQLPQHGSTDGQVGPNHPPVEHRFSSTNQPPREHKSAGMKAMYERKTVAKEMLNMIMQYRDMQYSDFQTMITDIKLHPEKYKVKEVEMAMYVTKVLKTDKFLLDWKETSISKAPVIQELSGPNGEPIQLQQVKELLGDGIKEDATNTQTG